MNGFSKHICFQNSYIPKLLSVVLIAAAIVSCGGNRYVNHKYRYSTDIPQGYVIVSPTDKSESNRQMILRIKNDNALPLYENVEAAMYRAESSGPVFDTITVSSLTKAFSMNQIENSRAVLEAYFISLLSSTYTDVRLTRSEFAQFKIGKTYRTDYSFNFGGVECYACMILLTSNPLYSSMITLICPAEHESECSYSLRQVVDSFKKR